MQTASPQDDRDLLQRMWAGDEDAFTVLYRRHQGAVYRFALHMSGKTDIADEVTQDTFMLLMRGRNQYDPSRGSLSAFLYGVARNHVLRALERERPYAASEDADIPVDSGDVLGDLTRSEQIESVRQAILSLPQPYREVVVLCELHELDYAEVAAMLQCPVGTVRSRLHRGRALLVWKLRASERCSV